MTPITARSGDSPTKRWWRRRRGGAHAADAHPHTFEFAHLLDPVQPPIVITGSAAEDDLALPSPPDGADPPPGYDDVADLLADGDRRAGDEHAAVLDVPLSLAGGSDDAWPSCVDEQIDVPSDADPSFSAEIAAAADLALVDDLDALLGTRVPAAPVLGPAIVGPEIESIPDPPAAAPAVSRFATAGLDDDRLPIVRSRRGRQSSRPTSPPAARGLER
jgi:hypothetical protein